MSESTSKMFSNLALTVPVLKSLTEVGYEVATPIQEKTIPLVFAGRDLIGQAQTGMETRSVRATVALPHRSHLA